MKNYSYNRRISDKLTLKGQLSADCSKVTIINDDKDTEEILVADCLEHFASQNVSLIISLQTDEDLLEAEED